ncbi:hypothetical protein CKAH01_05754 [Colletotrichum kahawae]|uniref:Uncharacterized protein n=1 Tax=Colletotrichum kahawae TaxID=34407 RepID=A0AAD9YFL3_COLKA|nr:hypothetical protein CKAH01_05754 [Colletotrichum kahawae]
MRAVTLITSLCAVIGVTAQKQNAVQDFNDGLTKAGLGASSQLDQQIAVEDKLAKCKAKGMGLCPPPGPSKDWTERHCWEGKSCVNSKCVKEVDQKPAKQTAPAKGMNAAYEVEARNPEPCADGASRSNKEPIVSPERSM